MNKKLFGVLATSLLALSGLVACNNPTSEATSSASSQAPSAESSSAEASSSESIAPSSAESSAEISSESLSSSVGSQGDENWVEYTKQVKLPLDYKNRDFYQDGIGQVTLKSPIDGDTAHFNPNVTTTSSDVIKARFFGIDTPESTGKIQEYGKGASNFTKAKLKEANTNGTIVVSSASYEYTTPEHDSTGSRYVSLVWVNLDTPNCDYTELTLLNLWIVEEGWSDVKNVADMPTFSDTFYAAESQAKAYKLNKFSGLPDPLFNYGEYLDTSLLDIKREIEKSLADSSHKNSYDGAKVRIVGTVAGYADNVLYLQNFYTKDEGAKYDTGEYAGINFFTGASTIPSKYTKRGTYIQVCGTATDSEEFGFQLSGGSFPIVSHNENDAQVLIKVEDNVDEYALKTFDFVPSELTNDNLDVLNCAVNLTAPVKVTGGYAGTDDITLYISDANGNKLPFDIFLTFNYKGDPEHPNYVYTLDDFKGKSFLIKGVYTYHRFSSGRIGFQVNPSSSDDIVEYVEGA